MQVKKRRTAKKTSGKRWIAYFNIKLFTLVFRPHQQNFGDSRDYTWFYFRTFREAYVGGEEVGRWWKRFCYACDSVVWLSSNRLTKSFLRSATCDVVRNRVEGIRILTSVFGATVGLCMTNTLSWETFRCGEASFVLPFAMRWYPRSTQRFLPFLLTRREQLFRFVPTSGNSSLFSTFSGLEIKSLNGVNKLRHTQI